VDHYISPVNSWKKMQKKKDKEQTKKEKLQSALRQNLLRRKLSDDKNNKNKTK
jgi:hypothetical protein